MSISSDLRHAIRLLGRSPVFTITAVASLALGIAATAAIFSLADAMLLRPRVGVANPETLVDIGRTTRGEGFDNFGYPLFVAMRDQTTLLDEMSAQRWGPEVMSLGDAESSERVFASIVSGNYFHVAGTRPALGRFFLPEEDRTAGTHPVVVLSHQLWTRRFESKPDIVGQTIRLNNLPYTVVGVAEAGFEGTTFFGTDFWVPAAMEQHVRASDRSLLTDHESVWMVALGRLKPGVTAGQARDELNAIARRYLAEHTPDRLDRWGIDVARSARVPAPIAGPVVGFIAVLGVLTGLVLLIACTNVASMLLARALERRREVATRLAIGASRGRILMQLLVEGLTLAILAGAISVPLAQGLTTVLSSFQPTIPIPLALHLQVDPRVMGFAFVLSALAAVFFALLPALQATRFDIAPALHGATATADRRRAWIRQGMVAAQVAMALLLLVAAGLFLRSLQEAATVDAGFSVENVDTLQIDTRIGGYRTLADANRVVDTLSGRFRLIPGVTAVGASRMVPLMGGRLGLGGLRSPGYAGAPDGSDRIDADWDIVTPGFFDALQLRLVRGRPFSDRDREGAPYVAIVNETMAARLWPGRDPIGQKLLQQTGRDASDQRALEIVGVAHDAKYAYITDQKRNFIYVPAAQQGATEITFYVRRATSSSRVAEMRQAVVGFDPMLPVIHTQTLKEATAIALLPQRLAAWIAAGVGSIGLVLAALGLYGLAAYFVAQRTREIALRMALGASREAVLSLVLRQSGRLAIAGTLIGFVLAIGLGMLVRSLLVGVASVDPAAFGIATLTLLLVLFAASWFPARRASRLDPMRALRAE